MEDNDFLPPRKKKKGFLLPSPAFNLVMRNMLVTHPFMELQERIASGRENVTPATVTPKVRQRSCKKLSQGDPRKSSWFMMYVEDPDLTPRGLRKFRRRFRLPYNQYVEMKDCLLQEEAFARWHTGKADFFGVRASPLELLLLGTLRYLGRGLTFDDIEEGTLISDECHRQFFHLFIEYGATNLYQKYILDYQNDEALSLDRNDYAIAGFPGAVGSLDATHIVTEKCGMSSYIQHKGFKMSATTRAYNITVNHRRYITSTTTGAPGSWNDKSIIRFDELAMGMRDGDCDNVLSFELYEKTDNGDIVKQKHKGGWFITDNGYHHWPIFIPPYKRNNTKDALRWLQWLESVRKDVECTFGILKGRWRILKAGVRLHGSETCDKVFFTCCSLHNLLLETDGLNVGWKNGAATDWQGAMGHFDPDDIPRRVRPPVGDHLDRLLVLDTSRIGITFSSTGNNDPTDPQDKDDDAEEEVADNANQQ